MKKSLSGLDMAPTLQWYEEEYSVLFDKIPHPDHVHPTERLPFPLRGVKYLQPEKRMLLAYWLTFPHQARERSVLRRIVGRPATWFHSCSLFPEVGPTPTEKARDALTPTAVIPSYCDYSCWQKTGRPSCDVHLFYIHTRTAPSTVRYIVHAEGFVHEVAHSIIAPALYNTGDYLLCLPDGAKVGGNDWLKNVFGATAQRHTPFSHYAGAYRDRDGAFKINSDGNITTAVSEEMAECVTALLLGFVFCREKRRRLDPFRDRPEVRQMVSDFLFAKHIPTTAATAKSA